MIETGIIMATIISLLFIKVKKYLISGWVFFGLMTCMILPSILDVEYIKLFNDVTINYGSTILLSTLLCFGFIPWYYFDKFLYKHKHFEFYIVPRYYKRVKYIIIFLIASAIFSIVYILPYALSSISSGADVVRAALKNGESVMPTGIMTTIAVGVAALNIYSIQFFFLSNISSKIKKYRFLLLLASMANVFQAFAFTGRDQLVILISFFIVFFLVFKNFLGDTIRKIITRGLLIIGGTVFLILMTFTLSRFDNNSKYGLNFLLRGTIGYISEQPYVFNTAIEEMKHFHGFERRFPLINSLCGVDEDKPELIAQYQWQFATMYGEFYEIDGWWTLILFSLLFIGYYSIGMKYLIKRRRYFGILLLFCVYLYLEITGMFYIKAGGSVAINLFYILLSIIPFCVNNYISIRPKQIQ